MMARRGGIRDDGGWPVRSRGEDGERGGSDVRKQERIREWWGQESEMVSAEEIWWFPGEGLLGKTGSSWRGRAVLTREVGQQRDSGKRMIGEGGGRGGDGDGDDGGAAVRRRRRGGPEEAAA